jgi:hypothetical protein
MSTLDWVAIIVLGSWLMYMVVSDLATYWGKDE